MTFAARHPLYCPHRHARQAKHRRHLRIGRCAPVRNRSTTTTAVLGILRARSTERGSQGSGPAALPPYLDILQRNRTQEIMWLAASHGIVFHRSLSFLCLCIVVLLFLVRVLALLSIFSVARLDGKTATCRPQHISCPV